jgi:hypothetical protein
MLELHMKVQSSEGSKYFLAQALIIFWECILLLFIKGHRQSTYQFNIAVQITDQITTLEDYGILN